MEESSSCLMNYASYLKQDFEELVDRSSKIYVAGHRGLVGSALLRGLQSEGYCNLVIRTSKELDLIRQADVEAFFEQEKPEYVFLAAAKVGGILANDTYRADFIYKNVMIEANVIHSSYQYGVRKLLFLGSSCIYPKFSPQPMKEEYLLTGELEPTNEFYAVAKIAGVKMCQAYNSQYKTDFISVMPSNLYGPFDNFDLQTSHVLPALIRKFHEAKVKMQEDKGKTNKAKASDLRPPAVVIWGTGTPRREFLYIDDLANACIFLMKNYDGSGIVNIGVGGDISISDLAMLVREIIGYEGDVVYDSSKPDGAPRKLLDVSKLHALGWKAKTSLREGIKKTYGWYEENILNYKEGLR
ncbi:bifunctional GDP-fucose synthetase: GDP-4-dehydro-6-deoxy-D-mannose epimerase and GDP-4-dehydro-6-L-deoxygalactose reductase [Candidatus Sulfobium mesophilum]|uniref:GDP-L-fucose synthase n=1 Tax=Candidatus Sulfobium mesophilum TaxID=2016548 RepID=A0A2U3QEQ7_9BACT|nr:bifunctional GDP-fucose synthetase: GDP-4-dehydro-6-deoxy-D-mannose epimerase and GDP-4-dehydro-6-L-deoxygalactose reductase [Candidatus Sulfobium mesophilum]